MILAAIVSQLEATQQGAAPEEISQEVRRTGIATALEYSADAPQGKRAGPEDIGQKGIEWAVILDKIPAT
jgi:hypothetical protein